MRSDIDRKKEYHEIASLVGEAEIFIPETFVPDLIISGGQTGADKGALIGAKACGVPTGGIAPRGWLTERGPDLSLADFGLVESVSDRYDVRTRENVQLADAIILIAKNFNSPGTKLTWELSYGKARVEIPYPQPPSPENPDIVDETRWWLYQLRPSIIMFAGNRESKAPGIERWAENFTRKLFS